LSVTQLNENFAAAWRKKIAFDYSTDAWWQVVEASFASLVDPAAVYEFFDGLYARFEEPESWRIYDDVRPALESLRGRGIRLAVVSNWDARLRPLLDRLGLTEYFDALLISAEAGVAKPSPRIFQEATARLKTAPNETLHVGDNEREDVCGAREAGLAAVRIDRCRRSPDDGTIPRLTDLDSLL
jgi:putative hydrolase of the HAD superfamily